MLSHCHRLIERTELKKITASTIKPDPVVSSVPRINNGQSHRNLTRITKRKVPSSANFYFPSRRVLTKVTEHILIRLELVNYPSTVFCCYRSTAVHAYSLVSFLNTRTVQNHEAESIPLLTNHQFHIFSLFAHVLQQSPEAPKPVCTR